ncbi:MAG TPA: type 2 lanthipeptide synthetase LanM family protein [Actinophytocola sp.]|uniref:type 2 lanthipeptide synthetase LanM family protein n=1 Tax=Actinophytocola sp. TaxID=1872138 RepID=UPI002DDD0ED9|nr:type 2 lanthipeptide synthetase LanM family protein [Actinophytocola sp.]HEV2782632.1 type 2 lanthipeptide synthetase LanM family protein [Actinophytocola sp.]
MNRPSGEFTASLGCLVEPALADLTAQLREIAGLGERERHALRTGAGATLYEFVHRKVSRVLLVELNAARVTGTLREPSPERRWDEFLALAAKPRFWESLSGRYPTMLARLRAGIDDRRAAAVSVARRFAADRAALAALPGVDEAGAGALGEVSFGAGDTHRRGQAVAILRCAGGTVVYKPRPVEVDAVLAGFLRRLLADEPEAARIRVPVVLAGDGYGWAEHVENRYCAGDAELAAFYRGLGHWLAVMRLLGGCDLHAENVIACGPVPVVVDCETLFTPVGPDRPSGLGDAVDHANRLIDETVLSTGLLPGRGVGLGWRGVDISAGGSLPGQQPAGWQPVIVDAGTDRARLGMRRYDRETSGNHPSPEPALARFWEHVLSGFEELTARLRALDRAGALAPMLEPFGDCRVRAVLRATEVYAELGRMLWHPVSLHDEAAAVARARRLLSSMAQNVPGVPDDPAVIDAEIDDLLRGDVPYFGTTARHGRLDGPGGTSWLPAADLVAGALRRWRAADLGLDRGVIRAALVSAYLNDGWLPGGAPLPQPRVRTADLDRRRRALAARIVRSVVTAAIHGRDGTVTWIAPVLNVTGWGVQPSSADLYSGSSGVAILLAAYLRETAHGRADEVPGLAELLTAVLHTLRTGEDQREAHHRAGTALRPSPPGGYIGLGSRIWAWLTLDRWGVAGGDAVERACRLAEQIPESVAADADHELLTGAAGAIVPLLWLAGRTGQERWLGQAMAIGDRLVDAARVESGTACWPTQRWPGGLGGFSHGATGVGWALYRLALATGQRGFARTADAAFAFEEALYDSRAGGWRDLREPDLPDWTAAAWCHGAVGIALADADLRRRGRPEPAREVLGRAAAATWTRGMGWGHTLCHGDLGGWEVLRLALDSGRGPDGLDRITLDARIIGSIEENGPVTGLARAAFSPGLLAGHGGLAYQLLRMHPGTDLPSVLTLGGEDG